MSKLQLYTTRDPALRRALPRVEYIFRRTVRPKHQAREFQ